MAGDAASCTREEREGIQVVTGAHLMPRIACLFRGRRATCTFLQVCTTSFLMSYLLPSGVHLVFNFV